MSTPERVPLDDDDLLKYFHECRARSQAFFDDINRERRQLRRLFRSPAPRRRWGRRLLRAAAWVAGLLSAGVVAYFLIDWLTAGLAPIGGP